MRRVSAASESFRRYGRVVLSPGSYVQWQMPCPTWVVGRLTWHVQPSAVEDARWSGGFGMEVDPVPSSDQTNIRLRSGSAVSVRLGLYSVSGTLVRSFGSIAVGPGSRVIRWDGSDDSGRKVGSGVYFLRVTGGKKERTSRIVIVR